MAFSRGKSSKSREYYGSLHFKNTDQVAYVLLFHIITYVIS